MLFGFWLGYLLRLIIATRFEVRENASELVMNIVVGIIGLFLWMIQWVIIIDYFIVGWSVVLGGIGWLLAMRFMKYIKLGSTPNNQDFFRDQGSVEIKRDTTNIKIKNSKPLLSLNPYHLHNPLPESLNIY